MKQCLHVLLLIVLPAVAVSAAERFPWLSAPQTDGEFRDIDVRLGEAKRNLYMHADALAFTDRALGAESPHTRWAKPWHAGPVRVLYITNPAKGNREIVELQQRLDADIRVLFVPIAEFWTRYPNASDYLRERQLRALDEEADVVVLANSTSTLKVLSEPFLGRLRAKVEAGAGFVMLHSTHMTAENAPELLALEKAGRADWKTPVHDAVVSDHPATRGTCFELIHSPGYSRCRPRPGATPLIMRGDDCLAAVREHGKGRVVGIAGLMTFGRSAGMPEQNGLHYRYWEQIFALRARCVLWAARKDSQAALTMRVPASVPFGERAELSFSISGPPELTSGSRIELAVFDDEHEEQSQASLGSTGQATMAMAVAQTGRAGRRIVAARLLDAQGRVLDWAAGTYTVSEPGEVQLTVAPDRVRPGDTVRLGLTGWLPADGRRRIRVRDAYGRLVVDETTAAAEVTWQVSDPRGILFRVTGDVLDEQGQAVMRRRGHFTCPTYGSDDYHNYFWPENTPPCFAPMMLELYRSVGVDGVYVPPWVPHHWYAAAGRGGMVLWGGNLASVAGRAPVEEDRLVYPPRSPQWYEKFLRLRHFPQSKELVRNFGVAHVSLQDEGHQLKELSFDDWTLAQFRARLRSKYGDLGRLNRHWDAHFAAWPEVRPAKSEDMKGATNFARWLEFRLFMDSQLASAMGELAAELRTEAGAPDLPVGVEGIFGFSSHHVPFGLYDYAKLSEAGLNAISPYVSELAQIPGGTQYDYDLIKGLGQKHMTTGWVNANHDPWQQRMTPWWGVFHGGAGASYFISSSYVSDMGARLGRARLIEEATRPLRHGVGKLLLAAERGVDPVAIYFDMRSFYLAWILDRSRPNVGWLSRLVADGKASTERILQDLGVTPGYVTERMVLNDGLAGCKMVILTGALALSDAVLAKLAEFAENGGVVVADGFTAVYDGTGRPADGARLKRLFGVRRERFEPVLQPAQYSLGLTKRSDIFPSMANEWLKAAMLETGLVADGATSLGEHVQIAPGPAFLAQRLGKGRTLFINTVNTTYVNDADERDLNAWDMLLRDVGIEPPAGVFGEGGRLRYYDVKPFRAGAAQLAGVIRSPRFGPVNPLDVEIRFGADGFLYDVVKHRALGRGRAAPVRALPAEAVLVASLPQEVQGVTLSAPDRARPGQVVEIRAALDPPQPVQTVFRVEVRRPDGTLSRALTDNLLAPDGRCSGRLPLALNAPKGAWTLRVQDAISGKQTERKFVVE